MTKRQFVRRAAWVGIGLALIGLTFGLTTHLLSLIPGVTEDNARRICLGISAEQVAAILGEPGDDGWPVELDASQPDAWKGEDKAGIPATVQRMEKLLKEEVDLSDVKGEMTLKEVLSLLQKRLKVGADAEEVLPIRVDEAAFKAEDLAPVRTVSDTPVSFPPFPKKMSVGTALRIALSRVPTNNATYLIREKSIEITSIEKQMRERVLTVYPVGDLVVPLPESRWAYWVKCGKARMWTWSSPRLTVHIIFNDNRRASSVMYAEPNQAPQLMPGGVPGVGF